MTYHPKSDFIAVMKERGFLADCTDYQGLAEAMQHCPALPSRVLVTGGGRLNPVLMQMLEVSLECNVAPVEAVGLDGDMLEAQAFGYLAVRVARGLPTSCPGTTGVRAAVGGGTLSVPSGGVI